MEESAYCLCNIKEILCPVLAAHNRQSVVARRRCLVSWHSAGVRNPMTTLLEILLVCCMKESGLDTEGGDISNGKGVWSETCG